MLNGLLGAQGQGKLGPRVSVHTVTGQDSVEFALPCVLAETILGITRI